MQGIPATFLEVSGTFKERMMVFLLDSRGMPEEIQERFKGFKNGFRSFRSSSGVFRGLIAVLEAVQGLTEAFMEF